MLEIVVRATNRHADPGAGGSTRPLDAPRAPAEAAAFCLDRGSDHLHGNAGNLVGHVRFWRGPRARIGAALDIGRERMAGRNLSFRNRAASSAPAVAPGFVPENAARDAADRGDWAIGGKLRNKHLDRGRRSRSAAMYCCRRSASTGTRAGAARIPRAPGRAGDAR